MHEDEKYGPAVLAAEVEPAPAGSGEELVVIRERSVARLICERGMVTAEWAIGIIAAVSLAGVVLALVVKGGPASDLISKVILDIIKNVAKLAG